MCFVELQQDFPHYVVQCFSFMHCIFKAFIFLNAETFFIVQLIFFVFHFSFIVMVFLSFDVFNIFVCKNYWYFFFNFVHLQLDFLFKDA
jgi:hypothetical protein